MITKDWLDQAVAVSEGFEIEQDPVPGSVERLRSLLSGCAERFASLRADVQSATISWPRRGVHADEAAAFLRARDSGFAVVDEVGFVTLPQTRVKSPAGRYALLSKSGSGVSVNLEYLIQIGTAAELAAELGWPAAALDFERGEFDVLGLAPNGDVVLAVEAKARVQGSDSLEKMLVECMTISASGEPAPSTNAGRKYREMLRLAQTRPIGLWLVAAGARWWFTAEVVNDELLLTPCAATTLRRATRGRPKLATGAVAEAVQREIAQARHSWRTRSVLVVLYRRCPVLGESSGDLRDRKPLFTMRAAS